SGQLELLGQLVALVLVGHGDPRLGADVAAVTAAVAGRRGIVAVAATDGTRRAEPPEPGVVVGFGGLAERDDEAGRRPLALTGGTGLADQRVEALRTAALGGVGAGGRGG